MTRKEIKTGFTTVAYGTDEFTGAFISVYDARLQVSDRADMDTDFGNLCEGIDPAGGGCYVDAHTGPMGFGKRVGLECMNRLWRLFGVAEGDINEMSKA